MYKTFISDIFLYFENLQNYAVL